MYFVRHGRARALCALCVCAVVAACDDSAGGRSSGSRADAASSASAGEDEGGAAFDASGDDDPGRADAEAEDAGTLERSDAEPEAEPPSIDAESSATDAGASEEDGSSEEDGASEEDGSSEEDAAGEPSDAAAGSDADPPDASPPASKLCKETCSVDQDCWEAEFGFESCVQGRCSTQCTSHDECSDKGAQGRRACERDAECRSGQVCVTLGNGSGRCATAASLAGTCAAYEWPRTRPRAEGGAPTEVCMTNLRCAASGCVAACAESCDAPGEPRSCDAETGLCVCRSDADCADVPNAPRCDAAGGRCVCRADADCKAPDAPRCDVATGACGCSADEQCGDGALCRGGACVQTCEDATSCSQLFFGTVVSCE